MSQSLVRVWCHRVDRNKNRSTKNALIKNGNTDDTAAILRSKTLFVLRPNGLAVPPARALRPGENRITHTIRRPERPTVPMRKPCLNP